MTKKSDTKEGEPRPASNGVQKNGVPEEFLKPYDPQTREKEVLGLWETGGFSNPDVCIKKGVTKKDAPAYAIVLPPPNVTGTLHMGHATMLAIQDILIRYRRMRGYRTLWLPGTDHAAIATQSVVEKKIHKEEKKTRHDLGREEFLRRVQEFAKESHDTIVGQIRAMGASVDWSREAFTLDQSRGLAVRTAFERMYDAGLIYRGKRIVNWDPAMQTTVSDDEIEYVAQKDPFYYFQYGPFVIGTVRPETKFGDKYVVMHPEDPRYRQFSHRQTIDLEWINGPITATVIKDSAVDMETGSGVMTITPAHSGIDFEIAQRHNLDIEQIIDERGILLPIAGEFSGQHIKKARPKIVEKLRGKGLIVRVEEQYEHNVAVSSRGGGVIEPQIKEQWFVNVNAKFKMQNAKWWDLRESDEITLKQMMRLAVESGKIKVTPERFERVYYNWIDNLRDWCISRQIWYGHRVPVWYCLFCQSVAVNKEISSKWFIVRHGETEHNVKRIIPKDDNEDPLTEKGKEQVRAAAKKLRREDIGLIVSSDFGRCKETAAIIAEVTGAEVVYDEALRERDFGNAKGLSYEENKKTFGSYYDYYDETRGNIETSKKLEERIAACFKKHKESHGRRNVVIVSHGSVIRMLIRRIRDIPIDQLEAMPEVQNAELIPLELSKRPCASCGADLFEQDPDTLDTWFSSGLWTFSTLGWPEKTGDLAVYHPTDVLETGYDILFFWVARMILMTGFLLGTVPFRAVYLHGLVRDTQGRKMSKSLGNILDPLVMTEKYGADAARLSLIVGAAPGNDVKLSEDRVRGYKNFANKIWNISRFILENSEVRHRMSNLEEMDERLLEEVQEIAKEVSEHIDGFRLDLAADTIYHYIWHRFADEILEESKGVLAGSHKRAMRSRATALYTIWSMCLKTLHPFMPLVTEAIWQRLPEKDAEQLMVARWPFDGAQSNPYD